MTDVTTFHRIQSNPHWNSMQCYSFDKEESNLITFRQQIEGYHTVRKGIWQESVTADLFLDELDQAPRHEVEDGLIPSKHFSEHRTNLRESDGQ